MNYKNRIKCDASQIFYFKIMEVGTMCLQNMLSFHMPALI